MKRSLKQRMLITVAATLVAALCGYAVAYWIGYEIALRLSAGRLGREAALAIVETETYARDDHAALDAMNASSIPHCSPEDMDFLHHLLYHLIFVKELGRIRDNRILCSTTIGRDHLSSVELPKPESIGSDGVRVYRDPQFFGWPNDKVVALQDGDSYVVLYPFFEIHQDSAPMQIATTVVGPERKQPLLVVNGAPQPSWPQLPYWQLPVLHALLPAQHRPHLHHRLSFSARRTRTQPRRDEGDGCHGRTHRRLFRLPGRLALPAQPQPGKSTAPGNSQRSTALCLPADRRLGERRDRGRRGPGALER
jgi:hypothetical protein